MAQTPPWLKYQGSAPQAPQPVVVPLGPAKPAPPPEGFRWSDASHTALEPIPGGPKDPHSKSSEDQTLSPEALDAETTNWILTGKMSPLGMGGGPLRVQIQNNRPVLMRRYGITENQLPAIQKMFAADSDAYNKRVGQGSFMQQAEEGARGHAAQIKDYLKNLPAQTNWRALNALSLGAQQQASGEEVTNLDATIPLLKSEIAKIMTANPTGSGQLTDDARHEFDILEGNTAPARKIEALDKLLQMADTKVKANNDEGQRLSQRMTGGLQSYAAAGGAGPGFGGSPPGGPPPGGPGAPPVGPDLTPATGGSKTEVSTTPVDRKIAAMLSSGAPSANIRATATAAGYPTGKVESLLAWRAMHPTYKGGYDVHHETIVPTTAFNRAAASPTAAGLLAAADAGTMGLTDEAAGAVNALRTGQPVGDAIKSADLGKQMLLNANPKASLAGSVVGGGAAMIGGGLGMKALLEGGAKGGVGRNLLAWAARNPIKATLAADTAYGTAYGAGENNDNRAAGALVGGATAVPASLLGQAGSKVLGGTLRGVVNPAVERLRAAGVPLTVGEVLGGGAKVAQDAMTSVFGPGGRVAARYADGRRALSSALFNQAGDTIDAPIYNVGQKGVEALDAAKSRAYSQALDPVSLNLNTPQFTGPMQGILAGAKAIPAGELPQGYAENAIQTYVGNNILPDGTMTGSDFQKAYRGLAQTARKVAPKVEGHDLGEAIGQAKDVLASTLHDQNPDAYAGFLRANTANRHLNVLADAVNAAKGRVSDAGEVLPTPLDFSTAATNNAKRLTGNIAAASGNRPFNQIINDAQQVMSSKLPDSGTPLRRLTQGIILGTAASAPGTAYGYGEGGAEGGAAGALGTAGLLTALGTRRGQQLLTAALLKRIAPFRIAGTVVRDNPQVGGAVLTAAGIPLLTAPSL